MTDLHIRSGEEPRICGHRGNMAHAPENTIAALRNAHENGARACEIDIRLTSDDQLVLMHDATLNRTTNGRGAVRAHTVDQVQSLDAGGWFSSAFAGEKVPLLSEAIEFAENVGLILRVELKDWHDNATLFASLSRALENRDDPPVVFCSFDHRQLLELKEALPAAKTLGIYHGRGVDMVEMARSARLDGLSVQVPALADSDIEALHAAGLALSCYFPMNEPVFEGEANLDKLRGWWQHGLVDMVTVNDVAWLRRSIDRH